MNSFGKLIKAAKNQPIEEETPVNLTPETSTKDSVLSSNSKKDSSKNQTSTQAPTATTISNQKKSSKKNTETGKRNNSDYRQTTIYVKKDLHRKLIRQLEDEGYSGDFSNWIEKCMLSKTEET